MQVQKTQQGYQLVKWYYGEQKEIPKSWEIVPLGKLCKIRKNDKISSKLYLGLEHIGQGTNQLEGKGNVSEFQSTKNVFLKGDVLYGKLRPLLNKVWLASEQGYCSTDILPLKTNKLILNQFLMLILSHHDFYWYAVGTSSGTKMPRTNWSDMKKFLITLPSMSEQQKICSKLSNVEELIESYDEVIESAKKLKKGLMQKLLTKGIGHTKFKKVKWLFKKEIEIPEEWEIKKLDEIVDVLDSKRIPLEESEREKRHGKYPYYGASGIIDYIDDYIFDETLLCLAEDGENLRSKSLPLVFTIKGKTWVNNHAHVLRSKETTEHYFLEYFLNHISFLKYVASTAQPKLNQKDMRSIPIIFPTKMEQQKIASILLEADSRIDGLNKTKSYLDFLKKGLMQKLLTGQIRVSLN